MPKEPSSSKLAKHHEQQELCKSRPAYRQGKKLTAIKTYSINLESKHLFIYGVPQVDLRNELKRLSSKYGELEKIHVVANQATEIFTECYHVVYTDLYSAKRAKRALDDRAFYGGILHVCYAPEHESVDETKHKLLTRKQDIAKYLAKNK